MKCSKTSAPLCYPFGIIAPTPQLKDQNMGISLLLLLQLCIYRSSYLFSSTAAIATEPSAQTPVLKAEGLSGRCLLHSAVKPVIRQDVVFVSAKPLQPFQLSLK